MKTAVVILNWNGETYLRKFLPPLVKLTKNNETEIYVADNLSSDASVEFISTELPEVRIILLDKNYGFAGGYNRALEQIEAEYYILVNSDIEVTSGWHEALIEFLENNKSYAACQPKIRSWSDKSVFEYAGAAGGFIDKYGYPFCRGRIFNKTLSDLGQYDTDIDVFWTSGACMAIRSEIWKESGGFDDSFFAHMEEIDLCWRIINRGHKLRCLTKSIVFHVGGGALSYNSPFKTYLNFRNNLYMLHKNLPGKHFIRTLFIRKMLDGIAALRFIVTGKFKNFLAVFHAHIDYYRQLPSLRKKRAQLRSTYPEFSNNKLPILNKSIVFEFYVRKNTSFEQIEKNF